MNSKTCLAALAVAVLSACAPPAEETSTGTTKNASVTLTLGSSAVEGIAELGLETPVTGRAFFIVSRNKEGEP